jgi:PHD/YefM family antitoxin component YafN of YafNO toxin-antitoxin module
MLPTIVYMMTVVPLAALGNDLAAHVASVEATHDRAAITRNGRVVAVLIAAENLTASATASTTTESSCWSCGSRIGLTPTGRRDPD